MTNQKLASIGALGLSLLLGAGALTVQARQSNDIIPGGAAPGAPNSVAMVDMEKLYTASGGPQALIKRQNEYDAEMLQSLNNITAVPYLKQQELSEYIGLLTQEKPTDVQTARLKALRADSDARQTELTTLSAKKGADLTAADKARITELTNQSRLLEKVMPNLQEALRTDEASKLEQFRREQMTALRSEVGKVAKERGVSQVFDSGTMVYSSVDITPQVLQKLNKRLEK